jgi:hypothetical protein
MTADVSAALVVENGVHQAARAELANGRNSVGCLPDNNIVISDLRNSGTSFTLEHRGRDIVLHADAPVELPSGKPLAPGQSKRCVNGMRFVSGGVALRMEIVGPGHDIATSSIRFRLKELLLAAATVAFVAMVSGAALSFRADAKRTLSHSSVETIGSSGADITGSIPRSSSEGLSSSHQRQVAAIGSLRRHLVEVELSSLVVTAQPDGSIKARGQITKEQESTWHEVQHWFDTATAGQVMLVNTVSVGAVAPAPLAIQAVWPGRNPYVIDGDGGKYLIGSQLPSGWTVAEINDTHVLVKRGQQTLSVRF